MSGDHQVVPGFLESTRHLLRESRPGELARTLDKNCGGRLRRERNVLVPPTLHHHNGLSLSARTGSQREIRSICNYEADTGDCLVCEVRFPSSRFLWLTWKPDRNQINDTVVIKGVHGHFRVENERNVLRRFHDRTPFLRPLIDEIEDPSEPPCDCLKTPGI